MVSHPTGFPQSEPSQSQVYSFTGHMLTRSTRNRAITATSSVLRGTLDSSRQQAVDAFLKGIKNPIRRARSILPALTSECTVLERLYYKGKNQHRSSLFWRRVSEMRRYGQRLEQFNLLSLLEDIRASFYDSEISSRSKRTKGAWTHCPDLNFLNGVFRQLEAGNLLVAKAIGRFAAIYQFLNVVMQNGTFLQLSLTLVAITSRLSQLFDELRLVLETFHEDCRKVFATLYSDERLPLSISGRKSAHGQPIPPPITLSRDIDSETGVTEDLGFSIHRTGDVDAHINGNIPSGQGGDAGFNRDGEIYRSMKNQEIASASSSYAVKRDESVNYGSVFSSSTISSSVLVKRKSEDAADIIKPRTAKKTKKGKKPQRRDEIDDIFGGF